MRDVVVRLWCDLCHAQDPPVQTDGTTYLVAIGAVQPREIDLCDDHALVYIAPLRNAIEQHGSLPLSAPPKGAKGKRPTPSSSGPNTVQALAERAAHGGRRGMPPSRDRLWSCLWCPLTYSSATGIRRHLFTQHGVPEPAHFSGVFGRECPLCGNVFDALSMHVTRTHGLGNVTLAFTDAAKQGDPHGVVERVHKAIDENVLASYQDVLTR